jgi:hypothetical protein
MADTTSLSTYEDTTALKTYACIFYHLSSIHIQPPTHAYARLFTSYSSMYTSHARTQVCLVDHVCIASTLYLHLNVYIYLQARNALTYLDFDNDASRRHIQIHGLPPGGSSRPNNHVQKNTRNLRLGNS